MTTKSTTSVPYRRKRKGKTDYRKRLKLLKSDRPRLVVRRSLKHITLQIVEYSPKGDKVIACAHSSELSKLGWKGFTQNLSACYLTGLLLARKVGKKISCALDIGQYTSVRGCKLYAAVLGALDGGLEIPCAKEVLPKPERVRGDHIAAWAKQLKSDKAKYERQFCACIKRNLDAEQLPAHFEEIKNKILKLK
jgi:large subunit ribosomal protein L18